LAKLGVIFGGNSQLNHESFDISMIKAFAVFFLLLSVPTSLASQGRLLGRVIDAGGSPVAAATVFLTSGAATQAAVSNAQGYYVFLAVPEGAYTLKAQKRGLPKTDPVNVQVAANTTVRRDVTIGAEAVAGPLLAANKPKAEPKQERTVADKPKADNADAAAQAKAAAEAKAKAEAAELARLKEEEELKKAAEEVARLEAEANATNVEQEVSIEGGREAVVKQIIYPETAVKFKIEGKVVSRVFVDNTGNVLKIDILKGAHELLNEEAVRVLTEETKYKPAIVNGKPVAGAITVPLNFKIGKVTW
jgi:TonB family protein